MAHKGHDGFVQARRLPLSESAVQIGDALRKPIGTLEVAEGAHGDRRAQRSHAFDANFHLR
jgi:hypothetical protein